VLTSESAFHLMEGLQVITKLNLSFAQIAEYFGWKQDKNEVRWIHLVLIALKFI
jgi:hypothetical protein